MISIVTPVYNAAAFIQQTIEMVQAQTYTDWELILVADGREGVVGTINLDYRSLYHHFECAVYLYGAPCIRDIQADFAAAVAVSRQVTAQSIRREKRFYKVAGRLLKVIAPLL